MSEIETKTNRRKSVNVIGDWHAPVEVLAKRVFENSETEFRPLKVNIKNWCWICRNMENRPKTGDMVFYLRGKTIHAECMYNTYPASQPKPEQAMIDFFPVEQKTPTVTIDIALFNQIIFLTSVVEKIADDIHYLRQESESIKADCVMDNGGQKVEATSNA